MPPRSMMMKPVPSHLEQTASVAIASIIGQTARAEWGLRYVPREIGRVRQGSGFKAEARRRREETSRKLRAPREVPRRHPNFSLVSTYPRLRVESTAAS